MARIDVDIDRMFSSHVPFGTQPQRFEYLRYAARVLAVRLRDSCPPSKELSLAMTRLQECLQMAIASIANNERPVTPGEHAEAVDARDAAMLMLDPIDPKARE